MPSSKISGTCEGLGPSDVELVTLFVQEVIRAFEIADPFALEALYHPGGDPRGQKNSFEFNRSLMEGGDQVRAWSARPYSEPPWDIMRLFRHHPTPTIWIDVTLNDGNRDYPLYFACSSNKDRVLRACYYVDR
jgi:hypothetical protein